MEHHDQVRTAARDKTSSPYRKDDRKNTQGWMATLGVFAFETVIGVHLTGDPTAPWWMVWGWWAILGLSLMMVTIFKPALNRMRRRRMLLAREQVFQARKLDPAADPVGFGMGNLHDAYRHPTQPGQPLDMDSALAGAVFAIARVEETFNEVDRATPRAKLFGIEIDDDGKVKGQGR